MKPALGGRLSSPSPAGGAARGLLQLPVPLKVFLSSGAGGRVQGTPACSLLETIRPGVSQEGRKTPKRIPFVAPSPFHFQARRVGRRRKHVLSFFPTWYTAQKVWSLVQMCPALCVALGAHTRLQPPTVQSQGDARPAASSCRWLRPLGAEGRRPVPSLVAPSSGNHRPGICLPLFPFFWNSESHWLLDSCHCSHVSFRPEPT